MNSPVNDDLFIVEISQYERRLVYEILTNSINTFEYYLDMPKLPGQELDDEAVNVINVDLTKLKTLREAFEPY